MENVGEVIGKNKNIITSLMEAIGKYGKNTLLFATMAFLVYVFAIREIINPPSKMVKEEFTRIDEANKKEEIDGIEKRKKADVLIPSLLSQLRIDVNASRVLILEFHNSTKNVNKLPFYYFSSTYEEINNSDLSIGYISDDFYYQRTGDYGDFLAKLRQNRSIFIPDLSTNNNSRMTDKLIRAGAKSVYFYEIEGISLPTGILLIESDKETLDENLINKNITKVISYVTSLLEGIPIPK